MFRRASRSTVSLELDVEPQGAAQQVGDMLGVLEQHVRSDLARFKELIESRDEASGAWPGKSGTENRGKPTAGRLVPPERLGRAPSRGRLFWAPRYRWRAVAGAKSRRMR